MISKETRKIIYRGILEEEKSNNHAVLNKGKKYETTILARFYLGKAKMGIETKLDDYILEELANNWRIYFDNSEM